MTDQLGLDLPHGCQITGPVRPGYDEVLTRPALEFVVGLARTFGVRVTELLARRDARQAEIDAGQLPDFLSATRSVRGA